MLEDAYNPTVSITLDVSNHDVKENPRQGKTYWAAREGSSPASRGLEADTCQSQEGPVKKEGLTY